MSEITEKQQLTLLTDPSMAKSAPLVLWRPLCRLAGSADEVEVEAAAASCVVSGDSTHWSVVWLTSTAIVHAKACKSMIGVWDAYSDDQACDDVTVWTRRLDEVQSINATEATIQPIHGDGGRTWIRSEGYQILFRDGETLDLPLFSNLSGGFKAAEPALEVLDKLVKLLSGAAT
jgi:hypothetical protein